MTHQPETAASTGRREFLAALVLTGIAILAFVAVFGLVNRFRTWQRHLADRLYSQGEQALKVSVPVVAIDDFRSALSFDEDNERYQFSLAQALEADNRVEEARSYLLDLWDRKPQDGAVNLELGRLSAQQTVTDRALRYYHNAIYGLWEKDPEANRHRARVEQVASDGAVGHARGSGDAPALEGAHGCAVRHGRRHRPSYTGPAVRAERRGARAIPLL